MEILSTAQIIRSICAKRGIPCTKEIEYTNLDDVRKHALYKPSVIVIDKDGSEHLYIDRNMRFDNPNRNIIAEKFIERRFKTFEDLGVVPEFIENRKICEGGGWFSKGSLYKVEDMYFES